jgi:hypothetical protein
VSSLNGSRFIDRTNDAIRAEAIIPHGLSLDEIERILV